MLQQALWIPEDVLCTWPASSSQSQGSRKSGIPPKWLRPSANHNGILLQLCIIACVNHVLMGRHKHEYPRLKDKNTTSQTLKIQQLNTATEVKEMMLGEGWGPERKSSCLWRPLACWEKQGVSGNWISFVWMFVYLKGNQVKYQHSHLEIYTRRPD